MNFHFGRALIVLLTVIAGSANADVMEMKNGSKIVGKLVSAEDGKFVFDTPFAGKISVKADTVEVINTDEASTVMMNDGEIYRDRQLVATEDTIVMEQNGGPRRTYDIDDIKYINPEAWRLGDGYQFTGRASLAFEAERGNSDTDEWDADYNMTFRSLVDRWALRGNAEYDEANGNKVTENVELRNRYDRFMGDDPDNYWGGKLRLEYDKFADLDLRTLVGPHVGREFFDRPILQLRAELGPVYVDEQFDVAEDNDYFGALVEVEAESNIIGFGTTLYLFHDTTLNFDSVDEPLSNTTIGLRMPLIFGFETSFQAKYEYNGSAPDDVDTTDETYSFRIGYAW